MRKRGVLRTGPSWSWCKERVNRRRLALARAADQVEVRVNAAFGNASRLKLDFSCPSKRVLIIPNFSIFSVVSSRQRS